MTTDKPKKQARKPTHEIWIVWGDQGTIAENGENSIGAYEFKTAGELEAFLTGIDCACGYLDYFEADSQEEAERIVTEAIAGET